MSEYKTGARLRSAVCTTEAVVISAPDGAMTISCGGAPMLFEGEEAGADLTLDSSVGDATQLGKRYTNDAGNMELLCVKPGEGALSIDGVALLLKGAKPLPSSD